MLNFITLLISYRNDVRGQASHYNALFHPSSCPSAAKGKWTAYSVTMEKCPNEVMYCCPGVSAPLRSSDACG